MRGLAAVDLYGQTAPAMPADRDVVAAIAPVVEYAVVPVVSNFSARSFRPTLRATAAIAAMILLVVTASISLAEVSYGKSLQSGEPFSPFCRDHSR